jgi:hypothetical protein
LQYWLIAVVVLLAAVIQLPQDSIGGIGFGSVGVDSQFDDGRSLEGVVVLLVGRNNPLPFPRYVSAVTNQHGHASFGYLWPGWYSIAVLSLGRWRQTTVPLYSNVDECYVESDMVTAVPLKFVEFVGAYR